LLVCCSKLIHQRDDQINRQFISLLDQAPEIKVGLSIKSKKPEFGSDGPVAILDENGKLLRKLPSIKPSSVIIKSNGQILLEGLVFKKKFLCIKPINSDKHPLTFKGKHYSGYFNIHLEGSQATLVNVVNMEEYVAGLLPYETSQKFVLESLKAQAVAARSYAFYKMKVEPRSKYFDILNNTSDQVYRGTDDIKTTHKQAVIETCGQVLSYNYKYFKVFYHAICGGNTSSLKNALDMTPLSPLSGQVCGFCKGTSLYSWTYEIKKKDLMEVVSKLGLNMTIIKEIKTLNPGEGGHSAWVGITDGYGTVHKVRSSDLRYRLGTRKLYSPSFKATIKKHTVRFVGRGWGHGVGMCQWGAQGMARAGKGYREILEWYYPRTRLTNVYADTSINLS